MLNPPNNTDRRNASMMPSTGRPVIDPYLVDIRSISALTVGREEALLRSVLRNNELLRLGRQPTEQELNNAIYEQRRRLKLGEQAFVSTKTNEIDAPPKEELAGYLFCRTTGALHDGFLSNLIERVRAKDGSGAIYSGTISPLQPSEARPVLEGGRNSLTLVKEGDNRFQFAYYDQYTEQGKSAGYLLWIRVNPEHEHHGYAHALLNYGLRSFFDRGLSYAFAIARMIDLPNHHSDPFVAADQIHEYVDRQRGDGLHPDPTIRFHQRAGGTLVCALPFAAQDPQSHFHGALVIYDLKELFGKSDQKRRRR